MRAAKILFSIIFLLILASNVRLISHWNESRGVYDDICYLRQAHLFQRFGWRGLDTSQAREDDGYLVGKLRSINFPTWNDVTTAPCHTLSSDGSKRVLTPPPGTGFALSLFPEGFQVVPLYVMANVLIAGFALFGLWRARRPSVLALASGIGAIAIYVMINPTKASYSMAPTMVLCAFAGLLTAKYFVEDGQFRHLSVAAIGFVLGLSVSFRIANLFLAGGYILYFGVSFLLFRNRQTFFRAFTFGSALVIGLLPVFAANAINSGNPFVSAYGGPDTAPPRLDRDVLLAYLRDTQFVLILIASAGAGLLWHFAKRSCVKRLAYLLAANLFLNLAFFASHAVFTPYYTIPISMLTLWTSLFAAILIRPEVLGKNVSKMRVGS